MTSNFEMYILTAIVVVFFYIFRKIVPFLVKVRNSTVALQPFCRVKPHWFLGHIPIFKGPNEEGMLQVIQWIDKWPRLFTFYFGPLRPTLVLYHPDTVKVLLKTAEPKSVTQGGGYKLLLPWIGEGLLLSSGDKWFSHRRLLTPGFHFDVLKPYINVFHECCVNLINNLKEKSANGESVEIFQPVSLCTLDVILRCAFSYSKDVQSQVGGDPYANTVYSISKLIVKRAFQPHMYFDSLYYLTKNGQKFRDYCDMSHQKALEIIQARKKVLNADGLSEDKRYIDFLDILLLAKDSDGKSLSDTDIMDEVETFMFEGHDTTASGISWTLYNLAKHPDIQDKARQEIVSVIAGKSPPVVTWDDLPKLNYLTMCIKESLRFHPPVNFISRALSKPLVIEGHNIPAGTIVDVSIWGVHHNKHVWGEDHMTYRPERFLPESVNKMDSYAFIPFSAGPRNCIGQHFAMNEMKCCIAQILQTFDLLLDESHKVIISPEIITKAKHGIKLYLKPRNDMI